MNVPHPRHASAWRSTTVFGAVVLLASTSLTSADVARPEPARALGSLPGPGVTQVGSIPEAPGDGGVGTEQLDAPPPPVVGDVALSSDVLRDLVAAVRAGRAIPPALDLRIAADRVRVEISHDLADAEIDRVIERLGGVALGRVPGALVEADIPIDRLVELEAHPGVLTVGPPLEINALPTSPVEADWQAAGGNPGGIVGEQVGFSRVLNWRAAGFTGAGIRVGIIDLFDAAAWNAAQAAGEVPAPAGTFCRHMSSSCSIYDGPDIHGVAVAEIVHEMAPGATLYLARVTSTSDLQAAVDYFASKGVDIITRSLASVYDGPGNGTGNIANVVNSAVAKGMTWFNSAGNSAGLSGERLGGYWRGGWSSPDGDNWLDFKPGDELLAFRCGSLPLGLRWSDWGSGRTNYDVYVFDDAAAATLKASATRDQAAGATPLEHFSSTGCSAPAGQTDYDYLAIWLFSAGSGTAGDVLEFMVNGGWLEDGLWSNPYSATQPVSDSASAGALSVGAIDPASGVTIAPYSSRGPTNDGRIKPDIVAMACVKSFSYRNNTDTSCPGGFNGTSAATPVAAGMAAVVLDSGWVSTPSALKSFIINYLTYERGTAGSDNTYGHGEMLLNEFVDIATSKFVANIEWIYQQGITTGCAPGFYCPDGRVTRGQMATFLSRALHLPATSTDFFTDDETNHHEGNINRLAAAGITVGCSATRFCPNGLVTRGQMATFLARAFSLPGTSTDYFTDDETNRHEANINRLRASGITSGCGGTRYCPDGLVTRGQMAAFLHRAKV